MKAWMRLKRIILPLIALFVMSGASWAAQKELPKKNTGTLPVVLEADEVSFDEAHHSVEAKGHAFVRYMDLRLHADRITMDTKENVICAYSQEGKRLRVEREGWNPVMERVEAQELSGTYLEYHLNDSTGLLKVPEGTTAVENGTLYISGGTAEVAPPAIAHDKKWVHGRNVRKSSPDDMIVRMSGASYTTCPQDEPHYHFTSKKAVLIPNRYIILHKPRVYAGKRFLFTVPFNVTVNQGPRRKDKISIRPNFDDDKRYGLEAEYKKAWNTGFVKLGAAVWTKGITEYDYRIDQRLNSWMALYAGSKYHYEDQTRETKNRPFWGMTMEHSGWALDVGWAQREKRNILKSAGDKEYETTVWRKPEAKLTSPWIGLHIGDVSQYLRFKGNWGKFEETGVNRWLYSGGFIERYGWGVDYYIDYPFRVGRWWITPFFKADYWNYAYKNDRSDRQEITTGTVGIRATCGIFELGSAYVQRRVSGRSAFGNGWDRVNDEDTFYQRIGVKLGPSLRFSVQAIFDLTGDKHEWKTMSYILTYNNSCCTWWEFVINEDKRPINNNNWMTLSFGINAFPESRYKWGNHSVENPFGLPGKLIPKAKPGYVPTMMETDGTLEAENAEIRIPVFDI